MNFTKLKSAKSVEGDKIEAYRSDKKANKYVYLMAGVHGDEVEGVYVLKNLFEWLENTDDVEHSFIIIPILNVDGYRSGTRVNAHGVDLNRNLPSDGWQAEYKEAKYHPGASPLSEPENIFMEKLFQKFPPRFIISFHSWRPIVNYNGDCEEQAKFIASFNNYEIADDIGYPTPGSLGEYATTKYDCPVITFECPVLDDKITLQSVWQENELAFKELLKSKF